MKNLKTLSLLFLGVFCLCCKKTELKFTPIKTLNYENTVNNGVRDFTNKGSFFLISGYENTKECEQQIDSFVNTHKDIGYEKFDNYGIVFYK